MPRILATLALGALLVLVALAGPASAPAAEDRPNVVVIMTDDQTYEDLEAMPRTQALIGDQGTAFERSYVSYPLCCPSRATYLTGQYAHNHRVRSNTRPHGGFAALDGRHTLPVWLQAAGYDTSHVGKYMNGYGPSSGVPPGWSDWHGIVEPTTYQMWGYTLNENGVKTTYGDFLTEDPALYQTDVLRDKAIEVIDAHAPGRDEDPFFLSLNFVAPHGEVIEPGFGTVPHVRPAPRHRGRFGSLVPDNPAFGELDVTDKPPYVRARSRIGSASRRRITTDFRARRESLLAVDEAVEAIVGALERTGRLERTYVLFTSDNGFFQGEHRITKGKYLAYDAASRVPLLMRGPGIAPGARSGELVGNVDLAPTLLDATGAQADRPLDGRSVLPYARDPNMRTGRSVLHEGLIAGDIDRDGVAVNNPGRVNRYAAIRTRRFLYVAWRGGARELYDLKRDPFELESVHRDPRYEEVGYALADELFNLRACQEADCATPMGPLRPLSRRAVRSRTR